MCVGSQQLVSLTQSSLDESVKVIVRGRSVVARAVLNKAWIQNTDDNEQEYRTRGDVQTASGERVPRVSCKKSCLADER